MTDTANETAGLDGERGCLFRLHLKVVGHTVIMRAGLAPRLPGIALTVLWGRAQPTRVPLVLLFL